MNTHTTNNTVYAHLGRVTAAALIVLGILATWLYTGIVTSATAAENTYYTASPTSWFGPIGIEGQVLEGQVLGVRGIAVNENTGYVYVTEFASGSTNRVQVFDAEGKYLTQISGSETPAGSFGFVLWVAIDNSSGATKGDVYIYDGGNDVIDVFDQNGKYLRQIASGGVYEGGIAVDGSGDVWAAEANGNVHEFTSNGELVTQFQINVGSYTGSIAVDSSNYIYACCAAGSQKNLILKYQSNGKELATVGRIHTGILAVDQVTHDVFANVFTANQDEGGFDVIERFGQFGEPYEIAEKFGAGEPKSSEEEGIGRNGAIAINGKTGTIYVAGTSAGGYEIAVFEAQHPAVPVLGALVPAAAVTRTTATLADNLNPRHNHVTYQFEYGATSNYGQYTSVVNAPQGGKEETIEESVKGLTPGTTYHYALIASDSKGTVTGPDQTFTTSSPTPPTVSTGGASNVTLTTATLTGLIDPMGLETSYVLELGTDNTYGTSIDGEVGASSENTTINVPLIGLAPETTYHYRFVGINSDGRVYGQDQTFTTPVYSHPIVLPNAEPLLAVPAIAFPTETANTGKPIATKKTKTKKHKSRRHSRHNRTRGKRTTPRKK
jgi:sugar lactone lactonase YvrE